MCVGHWSILRFPFSILHLDVVVARAGEPNLVPLLIGADYRISSSTPIDVFAPTNVLVEQTFAYDDIWDQWCPITHVKWAVDLGCSTSGEGTGTTLIPFARVVLQMVGMLVLGVFGK